MVGSTPPHAHAQFLRIWQQRLPRLDAQRIRAFGSLAEKTDALAARGFVLQLLGRCTDWAKLAPVITAVDEQATVLHWREYPGRPDLAHPCGLRLEVPHENQRAEEVPVYGLNLEAALLLAQRELVRLVPESEGAVRHARWHTRALLSYTPRWQHRRIRIGAQGLLEHLQQATAEVQSGRIWLEASRASALPLQWRWPAGTTPCQPARCSATTRASFVDRQPQHPG